jgi:lysophospholipase L1-like esterase
VKFVVLAALFVFACSDKSTSTPINQAAGGGRSESGGTAGTSVAEPMMLTGGGQGTLPSPTSNAEPLDATPDVERVASAFCPADSPCKVMPIGDSNTEAYPYRVALFKKSIAQRRPMTLVGSATFGPAFVDGVPFPATHEGHSGFMVDDIARLIENSLRVNQPHIALLMIGTNDAHRSDAIATAPSRIGAMLDRMISISPQMLIVVAKIIPTQENPATAFYSPGNEDRVKSFNVGLQTQSEKRRTAGKNVVMVDMHAAFVANPRYQTELMKDNLHPNGTGYARVADVWWDAIEAHLTMGI